MTNINHTWAIDNGNGDQITSGLPDSTARKVAQELANERGEPVFLYICDGRERDRFEQCDGNDDAEMFEPEESDLVLVEIMPAYLRASHEVAGNRGSYPANGAERYLVERATAELAVEADPEWVEILRDATSKDLERYEIREGLEQI